MMSQIIFSQCFDINKDLTNHLDSFLHTIWSSFVPFETGSKIFLQPWYTRISILTPLIITNTIYEIYSSSLLPSSLSYYLFGSSILLQKYICPNHHLLLINHRSCFFLDKFFMNKMFLCTTNFPYLSLCWTLSLYTSFMFFIATEIT